MHIWWCFFLAWFSCLEINCAENNTKGDVNIGRQLSLWLLDKYLRDDNIAQIMAKLLTFGIYRRINYLMIKLVYITIEVVIIELPCTVGLAIIVRKMRNILKRKKAFWQNIDPMIHKMKEKFLHAATKKRERERKKRELAIKEAKEDIALLKGYNSNPLRKRRRK